MSKKTRIVLAKPGKPATHTAGRNKAGKPVLVPLAYSERAKLHLENSHKKARQRELAAAALLKNNGSSIRTFKGAEWKAFVALWDGDEEAARQWLEEHPEARNRAIAHSARANVNVPQNLRY